MTGWFVAVLAARFFPLAADVSEESLEFRLGTIHVARPAQARGAVLMACETPNSDWRGPCAEVPKRLAERGLLVMAVDSRAVLSRVNADREACAYPAADFEAVSRYVQQKVGEPRYLEPVLLGFGSGAALAYAVVAQGPPHLWKGLVTVGFEPELKAHKSLCRGHGLVATVHAGKTTLAPSKQIELPWTALSQAPGSAGQQPFLAALPHAKAIELPRVTETGSLVEAVDKAVGEMTAQAQASEAQRSETQAPEVRDLPLEEVPAAPGKMLGIVLSGDGGWAGIDKKICEELSRHAVACVGLNSLQYFWKARTPEGGAADLSRIIAHYTKAWSRSELILIGYSFGADVIPFFYNRLPAQQRTLVTKIALLGPSEDAAFEFHLSDWFHSATKGLPTMPEVARITEPALLCIYGTEEKESLCPRLTGTHARVVPLSGGHHLGGDYVGIARLILADSPPN